MSSLFDDAVKAYAKYCEEHGFLFVQPSESMSTVGRKYVDLENSNGYLAKYEIASGQILEE